jgi:hypothetical protein
MNTIRILCMGVLLSLTLPVLAATDLQALQAEIDAKTVEIGSLRRTIDDEEQSVRGLETDLGRLRSDADALEQRKGDTLTALKAQFERIVADPSLELTDARQAYRQALEALAMHRDALAAKEAQIAAGKQRIAEARSTAEGAGAELASLRAGFDRARAERLFQELNVMGEITLTNVITCERDETIAACSARGEDEARALARERFGDQLLAAVTEADLVAKQRGDEGAKPTLIDSTVNSSGFRGQGDYFVELSARLRNETSQEQACRLLGLDDAQCRGESPSGADNAAVAQPPEEASLPPDLNPELEEVPEEEPEEEVATAADGQYLLTVRSNVYYDEVFIDGVAYGSTKLDVMLPAGEHDLEVRKPGHNPYRERINLSGNRSVKAVLVEQAE